MNQEFQKQCRKYLDWNTSTAVVAKVEPLFTANQKQSGMSYNTG